MAQNNVIVVLGATGAQGGGLARAILTDPEHRFQVRAVTRKPESEKALQLKEDGAEIVTADLDDIESLKQAFAGAYGAYCVTNYWEHFNAEKEIAQAENLAKAAAAAGLKHVIWSTLEDVRLWVPLTDNRMPTIGGKYKVPHFDTKGGSNHFFTDNGVPTTFLLTSFYWDNFIYFGMGPKKGDDEVFAITLPMGDKKLPGIATEDIGKCAFGIFAKGSEFIGKTVGIAGEHLTGTEMAQSFTKALGREVRYNAVPPEVYRSFGFPGADDLGNMFQFKHDFNDDFCKPRSVDFSRQLNPELQTFEAWLARNVNLIPIEESSVGV